MFFLDDAGYRYYLPANLSCSLRHAKNGDSSSDVMGRVCWSLLSGVAPRDAGKGLGKNFDANEMIDRYCLSKAQVDAIYRFLCFAVIQGDYGVSEDDYYALLAWKHASRR